MGSDRQESHRSLPSRRPTKITIRRTGPCGRRSRPVHCLTSSTSRGSRKGSPSMSLAITFHVQKLGAVNGPPSKFASAIARLSEIIGRNDGGASAFTARPSPSLCGSRRR
jgi:hypothetical protein